MSKSKIEWTDRVWNPVTGCTKISVGCKNCYAERMSKRLAGRCGYPANDPFKVTLHPDRLEEPLRWKKPSRVFVCSMADIFHDDVPDEYIKSIIDMIQRCQNHTFIMLTKRPARANAFWENVAFYVPRNLWLGITAENQEAADERIPLLLQTPAAKRFVSIEPMLGPVDLDLGARWCSKTNDAHDCDIKADHLHWVICGGESGPNARPMHPDWSRSLRDQCKEAAVPFFFKQWGEWYPADPVSFEIIHKERHLYTGVAVDDLEPLSADKILTMKRIGKKNAGHLLDGKEHREFPGEGK